MKKIAAYGTWTSRLTGEFVAGNSVKQGEPQWQGKSLYWLETRPAEKGRQTILCRSPDGSIKELLPNPWSARTKIHEYGGGSFTVGDNKLFFVNGEDQQIYQLNQHDSTITSLTSTESCRYGDLHYCAARQWLFAVCENHSGGSHEPTNHLVRLDLATSQQRVIEAGHDFVTSAQASPDGRWLAYITWDHPSMPWQATRLWLRPLQEDHAFGDAICLAGDAGNESIVQPRWSPDGKLYWISDRSGWWSLYQIDPANRQTTQVVSLDADFAPPQWVCGQAHYGFLSNDSLLACYTQQGSWHLARLDRQASEWQITPLLPECCSVQYIAAGNGQAAVIGGSTTSAQSLWLISGDEITTLTEQSPLAADDIAKGHAVTFPTTNGEHAYGFFYPPTNAEFAAPEDGLPPLIVIGHGGPTAAADPSLNLKIQYWTQRGFAVFDVNYRGSTGFGRPYRQALDQQWGVVEVDDLCAAAEYATAQGWVHPQQKIIRGSSAGGYSVLVALTERQVFNAGVCLYGIGDLETLATDTHKFEAHYLDSLIGPYPAMRDLYIQRSPLHKAANIRCPLLVFQGLLDKVVPPDQAEQMVAAVRQAGVPVAYITYADEGHGFRSAQTIQHQLDVELSFYRTIFHLAGDNAQEEMIQIYNWPQVTP